MAVAGRNILVTGASSGIGAALAEVLACRGAASLGLVGRRAAHLEATADRCRATGAEVLCWAQDLGDLEASTALVTDAWERMGGLDILVNNAAIPLRRRVTDLTAAELDRAMTVDFTSPARMTLAVLPMMLNRSNETGPIPSGPPPGPRGMVVNVASLGGRLGIPHEAAYCAAKAALCGFSEALALDLWDAGVTVRLVVPGPVDTEIWDRPGNEPAHYDGPKEAPVTVAEGIVALIEGDHFEAYLPDLRAVVEYKTADIDGYLEGAAAMARDAGDGG